MEMIGAIEQEPGAVRIRYEARPVFLLGRGSSTVLALLSVCAGVIVALT
jgi:hypothetical protein